MKIDKKKIGIFSGLAIYKEFFSRAGIKPGYFIMPAILNMIVALLEGLSLALLIPLVKGVIKMDFGFVSTMPVFRSVFAAYSRFHPVSNLAIFLFLVFLVFTAMLIKNIFRYLAALSVAYQGRRFTADLKKTIFNRYLDFGKLFFDRNNEGYLHNLLLNFTHLIVQRIVVINNLLSGFFMLVVYVALMFAISWKMTMFIMALSPLSYFSVRWLIEKIRASSKSYTAAHNMLSKKISNILSCMTLVKAQNNEEPEKKNFAQMIDEVKKLEFSIDKKFYLLQPLQEMMMFAVILILVFVAAAMVIKGKEDISGFLVYFYLLRRMVSGLDIFNTFRGTLAVISGPMAEVSAMLEDKDKFFVRGGTKEFDGLRHGIEFKSLNFSYPEKKRGLKDLSLAIDKGKITAIVGPTGMGKTTLINLIMRFYECPPSSILVDGMDIREFSLESLRRHIALVSQDTLLFNDSLRNNIIYGLDREIKEDEIIDISKKARLYDFIMSLPEKFDTHIGDRGVQLSGGEKQRLSIARALIKKAEILILDEATSSLDTNTERLIQDTISEMIKGKTSIVIAHRLSTIRDADKIAVLEDGRIVEEGPLAELLDRKGRFYKYWEEQKFF